MKQFICTKRDTLFKGKYLYKVYFDFSFKEIDNDIIWLNPNHKKIMDNIKKDMETRFKDAFKIQKNIIYCENLDVAFYLVMANWERVKLIEKALVNFEYCDKEDEQENCEETIL